MQGRRIPRGRWLPPALGALLFLFVFLFTLGLLLPRDTVLSPLRSALSRFGVDLSCEEARLYLPFQLGLSNVSLGIGGHRIPIDTVTARWEWTGLFRWLPFRLNLSRGRALADVRTSPRFWNPGAVELRIERVESGDLAPLVPDGGGYAFSLEEADVHWKTPGGGSASGGGTASLESLRIPIPTPDSPVREALLQNVRIRFVIRQGTALVSSLTGTYEGSDVEGTGEIARFLTPYNSAITFNLRIRNPFDGKVATMFQMVSKNARNATLRIGGSMVAPTGEFQFF